MVWDSQSKNALGSMPLGGGDIGCNVWVENGDILFYMSRSGTFDENNTLLKLGRTRLKLSPNPFEGEDATFKQELNLREGCIYITGKNSTMSATVKLWVEVFQPKIHVEIESSVPIKVASDFEIWRTNDKPISKNERMQCLSFLDTEPEIIPLTTYKDSVKVEKESITWFHRNKNDDLVFHKEVTQQRLDDIREQLWNPLENLTFGGYMKGKSMSFIGNTEGKYMHTNFIGYRFESDQPNERHEIDIFLHVSQTKTLSEWETQLDSLKQNKNTKIEAWKKNMIWWEQFWNRSHIVINDGKGVGDQGWEIGRNYQLFRYILACNAYGDYPSKFNGSLFTVDNPDDLTPDFRMWGGGSFTAQNQRLVYWPMLRSGDFDMMHSQFKYYLRAKNNAELRTQHYWGHNGAGFTEQIANYGLPIGDIYHYMWGEGKLGVRPDSLSTRTLRNEKGEAVEVKSHGFLANNWCEDQYDTALEFCLMILDMESYSGEDISKYMPLIESCITFYNEHYRYWNTKLNGEPLNKQGKLNIYPSSAAETYKVALNATPLVAGLQTVLTRMLELPEKYASVEKRNQWKELLKTVPSVSLMEKEGYTIIAPAKEWERVNNIEFPAMYAVYPYNFYGLGNERLQIGVDTWLYGEDPQIMKRDTRSNIQKSDFCWFQSGIFCARLGLTEDAKDYLKRKMLAKSSRFPAFWDNYINFGTFCQTPDLDHGGAGMINLQEMLLQTKDEELRILPAWPKEWDVKFKLYAPNQTTIEVDYSNKSPLNLKVTPEVRKKDLIVN
nr:DUF5703 domain-containing protein [Wocania arenilitoris]